MTHPDGTPCVDPLCCAKRVRIINTVFFALRSGHIERILINPLYVAERVVQRSVDQVSPCHAYQPKLKLPKKLVEHIMLQGNGDDHPAYRAKKVSVVVDVVAGMLRGKMAVYQV